MPFAAEIACDFAKSIKQKAYCGASEEKPPGPAVAGEPQADGGGNQNHRQQENRPAQQGVEFDPKTVGIQAHAPGASR